MRSLTLDNLKHFYFNKYVVSPVSRNKYPISYCYDFKAIWFRTYKVASRTISDALEEASSDDGYIYSSEVGYLPERYKDFFKFAFVRDPIDRFISIWKGMVLKRNYFKFDRKEYQRMKDFDEFLEWVGEQDIENADIHLRPQNTLIDLNNLDFIGRFENFEKDFQFLAEKIGLPVSEIGHLNPSPQAEISLSDKQVNQIEDLYAMDVQLFYPT